MIFVCPCIFLLPCGISLCGHTHSQISSDSHRQQNLLIMNSAEINTGYHIFFESLMPQSWVCAEEHRSGCKADKGNNPQKVKKIKLSYILNLLEVQKLLPKYLLPGRYQQAGRPLLGGEQVGQPRVTCSHDGKAQAKNYYSKQYKSRLLQKFPFLLNRK